MDMAVASRVASTTSRRVRPTRKLALNAGGDVASRTDTATYTGSAFPSEDAYQLDVQHNVTAISGTGATITLKLQGSMDNSTWSDIPNGALTALTAAGSTQSTIIGLPIWLRWVATIAGTSPSITWNVDHQARTSF